MIPFNIPYKSTKAQSFISIFLENADNSTEIEIILKCEKYLESKYNFKKVLLTNSCTAALEISALICDLKEGDEVIIPSYTYVSTANAFALRGAKIIFADSEENSPNINIDDIEKLITAKTRIIVAMHYAGVSCDMKKLKAICDKYKLFLIEDAAQCINAYYEKQALGSFGDLACFSFHKTKNIHCYEGGFLVINNKKLQEKAEIAREKGTNKIAFDNGEVNKYEWINLGFSAAPSPLTATFLYSQLLEIDVVQSKRVELWNLYLEKLITLKNLKFIDIPVLPNYASNNAHIFYFFCKSESERNDLLSFLKSKKIQATFHYLTLHDSIYFKEKHTHGDLLNAKKYEQCLVRLPLYYSLEVNQVDYICEQIKLFFKVD